MASGRQSDIGANTSRSLEAGRIVDRRLEAERGGAFDYGRRDLGEVPGARFRTARGGRVCSEPQKRMRRMLKSALQLLARADEVIE